MRWPRRPVIYEINTWVWLRELDWKLQQQGFDFCYDKRLFDRLEHGSTEQVRLHLCAEPSYQEKLVRFLENHDEPRGRRVVPGRSGTGRRRGCPHLAGGQ